MRIFSVSRLVLANAAAAAALLGLAAPAVAQTPVFTGAAVEVAENLGRQSTPAGATIAVVAVARDPNGDQLQYTVLGALGEMFSMVARGANAAIVARRAVNLNHEASASHVLDVQVRNSAGASVRGQVTINVLDRDEAPAAGGSLVTMAVRKPRVALRASWDNSGYHASLGPADRSHIVLAYVSATNSIVLAGSVTLAHDATTGMLAGLLPGTDYRVSVLWFSQDGLAAASDEIMAATAVNSPPQIGGDIYRDVVSVVTVSITENVPLTAGEVIFDLSSVASDADNDELTFIYAGDAGFFMVDRSGKVIVGKDFVPDSEYTPNSSFFLVGHVEDGFGGKSKTSLIYIGVEDVNEPPVFDEGESVIVARYGRQQNFILAGAEDPDRERAHLTYSVDPRDQQAGITFKTTFIAPRLLKKSASVPVGVYMIRYKAQEANTADRLESVKIYRLIVTADPASIPAFDDRRTLYRFPENRDDAITAAGIALATVTINNSAMVGEVSYRLIGSDSETGPFAIGSSDGIIRVARATNFNREEKRDYAFAVQATIAGNAAGLAEKLITLRLDDVNDPPRFHDFLREQRFIMGTGGEYSLFFFNDPGGPSAVEYLFDRTGLPDGIFLDGHKIIIGRDVPAGSYALTITLREVAVPANLDVATVTLHVQGAGNEPPNFAAAVAEFSVPENRDGGITRAGTAIGSVAASDPDENILVYSIVAGSDPGPFMIGSASGAIMLAADHEFKAAIRSRYRFFVQVSDLAGGLGTIEIVVTVLAGRSDARSESENDDRERILIGEIDLGIAAAAVNLIGQRIMQPASPEASLVPAAGDGQVQLLSAAQMWTLWRRQEDAGAGGRMRRLGLREFIHERGLDFGLSSSGSGLHTRLWGSGNIVSLDGNPVVQGEELSYDGDVNILMLGVEAVRGDSRLGMVVASSEAEIDFGENGRVEREMTSIHPYLSWRPQRMNARVWLSAGIGKGPFVNERGGGKYSRDGDYVMFAGGVSGSWERDGYDLSLAGKAFTGTSELEASDALGLAETEAKSWRLEAQVGAGRDFAFPERGISLRPFVSIDGRRDRSEAALLNAFDVGGGVQVNWDLGMRLEASGRWQATDAAANEKSFGGSFSYDFGSDGKGLLVSLAPEVVQSREEDDSIAFRRTLRSRLGYARPVRIFGHSALMKVSADATYGSGGGSRDYGWRLAGRRTSISVRASASGTYRLDWSWR